MNFIHQHDLVSQQDENQVQSTKELLRLIQEAVPNKQETIMTFADQLVNQGLQQGLQQGKLKTARNMLSQGLDRAFIKRMTELNDEDLEGLN